MSRIKVMTVFGTRPEAIKMAPVVLELAKHPEAITSVVAVTAQHREMLDQVLNLFNITPSYDLDIMSQGQTLFDITCRAMQGLSQVLVQEKPDIVLVHGDTTTTFAGAMAAFYHQIAVGHVEAGLRTGDKFSPFPEEMNRKLTGSLADIHFTPTATAKQNLLQENVGRQAIVVTGNTVIDALMATVDARYRFTDPLLQRIDYVNRKVILVTTHRRENLGEPMRHI
ncbi:MAG: non-hydrolyzing UDP-N-acetylglucosamine 2-epimerase, partial [Sporomusa sp.]